MLRNIFGPKTDEVTREWSWLHNEDLNNQYSKPDIIRMNQIRKNKMREHVARTGEGRGAYKVCWENVSEREHLGDIGVVGRIILN